MANTKAVQVIKNQIKELTTLYENEADKKYALSIRSRLTRAIKNRSQQSIKRIEIEVAKRWDDAVKTRIINIIVSLGIALFEMQGEEVNG